MREKEQQQVKSPKKKRKRKMKENENLSFRDYEDLMGMNMQTLHRKNGALRRN